MLFAFPLAFLGLLAVPALIAIYWLRNRSRKRTVSSLMLWMEQRQLKEGGLVIHRLQTPLLFLLELLAILLLVIAAAGPLVRAGGGAKPLVIVLDDSFSMLAGTRGDSARHRGEEAIRSELHAESNNSVKIVLAGESPQMLGETTEDPKQLNALLEQWKCFSPSANLEEAITFAFAVGGDDARALVITDHPPSDSSESERLEWRAFGKTTSNLAFVNATRNSGDAADRCLLEIANASDSAATTELVVETSTPSSPDEFKELRRSQLTLPANASQRVVLNLDPAAGPLQARIGTDQLAIDDSVTLVPEKSGHVRVEMRITNGALRSLVESAVKSISTAEIVEADSQIVLTDDDKETASASAWVVRFIGGADAQSYIGPFVINKGHSLSEGLSLDGVIWGAGKTNEAPGSPVITAGNVPLVSDIVRPDGAREVRIWFSPELSTIQRTPAWPVLIWNLCNLRASELPGVKQTNIRLGSEARMQLPTGITSVEITEPGGERLSLTAQDRRLSFKTQSTGTYLADIDGKKYSFSVNALRKEESDLSNCASGRWGSLVEESAKIDARRNIAWLFILLLMIVLALHMALVSRELAVRQA